MLVTVAVDINALERHHRETCHLLAGFISGGSKLRKLKNGALMDDDVALKQEEKNHESHDDRRSCFVDRTARLRSGPNHYNDGNRTRGPDISKDADREEPGAAGYPIPAFG